MTYQCYLGLCTFSDSMLEKQLSKMQSFIMSQSCLVNFYQHFTSYFFLFSSSDQQIATISGVGGIALVHTALVPPKAMDGETLYSISAI